MEHKLWEAVAAGAGSLSEYGSCFDIVTISFSKGLRAPVERIIVGSKAFIRDGCVKLLVEPYNGLVL
jgi:threonine aldolase